MSSSTRRLNVATKRYVPQINGSGLAKVVELGWPYPDGARQGSGLAVTSVYERGGVVTATCWESGVAKDIKITLYKTQDAQRVKDLVARLGQSTVQI